MSLFILYCVFVSGMVTGKSYFDERPMFCDVSATMCLCACVTALLSIGGISFNRYVHICHSAFYPRIFTLFNNILMCVGFWLSGILVTLPPLLGWTDNIYDVKLMECRWSRTQSLSYTVFFSICIVFMPISVISVSYVKIFLFFRASKTRVATSGSKKKDDAAFKLARSLFVVFSIFTVRWTPYAIMALVDYNQHVYPHEVMLFVVAFAHMHSTLNPIVYGLTNRHFRAAFSHLIRLTCNAHAEVRPKARPMRMSWRIKP